MKYFKTEKSHFCQDGKKIMAISLNGSEFTIEKVNEMPKLAIKSNQIEFDTVFKKTLIINPQTSN